MAEQEISTEQRQKLTARRPTAAKPTVPKGDIPPEREMLSSMTHSTLILNERETAGRLGVPVDWLRREAEAGRVPCLRIGKRRHYMLDSVLLALAERSKSKAVPHA